MIKSITPFLWFDTQAEDAAKYYVSLFPDSRILQTSHYGEHGPGPKGSVMVVSLELAGQKLIFLNAGPHFKLDEAFSLFVQCTEQSDIDRLWTALTDKPSVCGWTKDKFGVSWQIGWDGWTEVVAGPKKEQAMAAMMQMTKIDIQKLKDAVA
jgi:predicted 3-demethylubiquinone-9 3-methyltransferase (glyoxalase superfamily)